MLAVLAMLAMASCNNQDKRAEALYAEAETMFEQKDYEAAKLMIDSIKTSCPKAFATRKRAIGLMQRVELAEQQRSIAYLDSLTQVWLEEFDKIKGNYKYRRNPEYQDQGTFIVPSQDLAANNNRTMLVASTDEEGVMRLTSVLIGKPIDHHVIKVTLKTDDTFAQTGRSDLYYTSTHLGVVTEKAEFEVGRTDGGVADFIIINRDKQLTIECQGTKTAKRQLTKQETDAVVSVHQLAGVLSNLHSIAQQKAEAENKINFIKARMSESSGAVKALDGK